MDPRERAAGERRARVQLYSELLVFESPQHFAVSIPRVSNGAVGTGC